jgi:membrane-associated phospholipid phosphatase
MRRRAIAVGIIALVWTSGPARAEVTPSVADLSPSIDAPPATRPRPIPFLPALTSGAAWRSDDATPEGAARGPHHSTVLREMAMAGAAIGAGFLLDDTFEPGSGEGSAMDKIGQFVGSPFTLGAGSVVMGIGGKAADQPYTVGTAKKLILAIAATTVTAGLLKISTDRVRPDGSNANSFPSGHAGASFAAATVLDRRYHSGALKWTAYGVATFVAASRVVGNHHFFSDVVAGAALGRFYGRMFTMDQ